MIAAESSFAVARLEKRPWSRRPIRAKLTPPASQIWKIRTLQCLPEIHSWKPGSRPWMTLADAWRECHHGNFGELQLCSVCKLQPFLSTPPPTPDETCSPSWSPLPSGHVCPDLRGKAVGAMEQKPEAENIMRNEAAGPQLLF